MSETLLSKPMRDERSSVEPSERPFADEPRSFPRWMTTVLAAAAVYNLLWGTWVIARPDDIFNWTGMTPPRYPGIWQCVGMIVGVYGVGYAIAARNPLRHWPIVFVGFLGKVFGPLGMLWGLRLPVETPGRLPASWLWLNLTNDVIWWIPFGVILYAAFKHANQPPRRQRDFGSLQEAHSETFTQHGRSLHELSRDHHLLMVFLRHRGCTFCRETLAEIGRQRDSVEQHATIVLVHMGKENPATDAFFRRYGLENHHRISDPECRLYRAYRLRRGRFLDLFGRPVWWNGFRAAILRRHGIGKLEGDGFQMGGVFLVHNDRIVRSFQHSTAADRPDYCDLATA